MTTTGLTPRENRLRAYRRQGPDSIPVSFSINASCWQHYPVADLERLMAAHPRLFPGFQPGQTDRSRIAYALWQRAGERYADSWGCVWETAENGITGAVVEHPLADWNAWSTFRAPDPETQNGWGVQDWEATRTAFAARRAQGELCVGGLRHGFLFLTLTYLRGYENLIYDMCDEEPRLPELIAAVESFHAGVVTRMLAAGAEVLHYPEDLGMQQGPMLSPEHFRRYIRPAYQRLMRPAREQGVIIHMHSDGHIMDLVDDLLACGVDVLNLQDLVNGIDEIARHLKGRVCIDLDIDRQSITRFGTPQDVDDLIHEAVDKLNDPAGGLCLLYGLYPGVPLENIRALMKAFETYSHPSA